jgi:hypothetical protein
MRTEKIYAYHKLEPLDILDSLEWAKENYDFYNGEVSFMWNPYVLEEFARLSKKRDERNQDWSRTFSAIAADIELGKALGIGGVEIENENNER